MMSHQRVLRERMSSRMDKCRDGRGAWRLPLVHRQAVFTVHYTCMFSSEPSLRQDVKYQEAFGENLKQSYIDCFPFKGQVPEKQRCPVERKWRNTPPHTQDSKIPALVYLD